MPKRGLDGRTVTERGRIRAKNGSAKAKNLAETYPEFRAFSPNATLTGLRDRYGTDSIADLRRVGARKTGRR